MEPLNFIKVLRENASLSQAELATLASIPLSTLKKWEREDTFPTDVKRLYRIAIALNCRIADLINWGEVKKLKKAEEN